jgi:hypothetical protein
MNLPKAGNVGLAVQVATALALGYMSEMFFTKNTAAAILAGGLTAPVETLIVGANVPYLSAYLSPVGAGNGVAGYVPSGRVLSGYVSRGTDLPPPSVFDGSEGGEQYWQ